MEKIKEPEQEV